MVYLQKIELLLKKKNTRFSLEYKEVCTYFENLFNYRVGDIILPIRSKPATHNILDYPRQWYQPFRDYVDIIASRDFKSSRS